MAVDRKQIHDLNNYLNKITITCGAFKDILETESLDSVSVDRLRKINSDLIKAFSDMEKTALDASNILFRV